MSAQYIFTTYKLSRRYPPDSEVLTDISLSFLPGAKIGVLGYNGAGKSTLLRIMAGHRHRVRRPRAAGAQRDRRAARAGARARPGQGRSRQRRGGRRRGPGAARPLQRAVDELLRRDRGRVRQGAGADRRRRRLEPRHDARDRDGRAALPAGRRRRDASCPAASAAASRCAGCCCASPTCCCSTSRPTTSTPSRSPGSSATSCDYPGTIVAVTHDRYFLDNVAGWILELDRGRGIPYQGNYSGWLEQKRAAARVRSSARTTARQRTIERELEWVRLNASARRNKPKARLNAYEALLAEDRNVKLDQVQIHIPAGPRLGDVVVEADGRAQGLRRPAADRRPRRSRCPRGGIVGVIGPNGAGKTTLMRMITGEEQPDDGHAAARRHRRARVRRPVARRARRRQDRLGGDLGRRGPDHARRAHGQQPRLRRRLQLQGHRPAEEGRQALGRRAQPPAPGEAAAHRRQPAAARRADQRPRRRHAARARGGAAVLRRLRRRRLPRSLVPRPDRHPRARVRGRLAGALVRGQLRGLRELPPRAARRRGRPPAPDHVQEARPGLGRLLIGALPNRVERRSRCVSPGARRLVSLGGGRCAPAARAGGRLRAWAARWGAPLRRGFIPSERAYVPKSPRPTELPGDKLAGSAHVLVSAARREVSGDKRAPTGCR